MMSFRILHTLWMPFAFLLILAAVAATSPRSARDAETAEHSRRIGKHREQRRDNPEKSQDYVTASTRNGKYKGKVFNILDTRVAGFLGMRYGKPTGGEMRFRKPKPVEEKWSGIRDATTYPNTCYQWTDNTFGDDYAGTQMWNPNTDKSEDCLFLNVWTPLDPSFRGTKIKSSRKLPVMVWIFGGGFYSGTSTLDLYQGQWLAASEQVVVVSMNYRVAAFGFLALGIEEAPGNAGLWDQNLALLWIRDNIHHFRGDKDRITLFGESAGAASVSMHMLSEKSNSLFRNAILQSSSVLSPWALLAKGEMKRRAINLARAVDCNVTNENTTAQDMVSCLAKVDAQYLADKEIFMEDLGTARFQNAAVIDEDFLTEETINKLVDGRFTTDINILGGFNANEGNYFLVYSTDGFNPFRNDRISYSQYRNGVNKALWGYPWSPYNENDQQPNGLDSDESILQAIDFEYTDFEKTLTDSKISPNASSEIEYKPVLDLVAGDLNFVCPTIDFMKKSRSEWRGDVGSGTKEANITKGNKYLYHFLHRSSQTPWPEWTGTLHGYEIGFVFGIPLNTTLNYTSLERELSKKMMTYWSNFAKTGSPNGNSVDGGLLEWPLYDSDIESSLVFDIASVEGFSEPEVITYTEQKTRKRHCQFWNSYYSFLQERAQPQDVYCPPRSEPASGAPAALTSYIAWILPVLVTQLHNII